MTCARVMRGKSSTAKQTTPASAMARNAASLPKGSISAITNAPFFKRARSAACGRRTFRTISALLNASRVTAAPAAAKSASRMPDFTPAPGSTATSAPSAIIFLTVSGVAATRGSPASVSAATAIFIKSSGACLRMWPVPSDTR
jgi:hypothetical protein